MKTELPPMLSFAEKPPAGAVAVDLPCVVEQGLGLLIYGGSGSGKSHCLRCLLEQTHGRVQHIVLDSEGEFHTLRERFPYLLVAREDGDVTLAAHAAAPLAARIMETGVSAIIDLSGVRSEARPVFVAAFLDQLIETPPAHRRPCLLVVDEVHRFAPQQAASVSKAAIGDVIAVGRKRGLIPVYATQSIERVDKNAISEIPNRLVGRIDLDVRMDRAADDLGLRGEDRGTLKAMRRGEFYAQGPILTRSVTLVRVPDTITQKPALGAPPHVATTAPALADVLARFADLPGEDAGDVGSLAEARKRIGELQVNIGELQAKLRETPVATAEPVIQTVEVEKRVEVPILTGEDRSRLEWMVDELEKRAEGLTLTAGELRGEAVAVRQALERFSARDMPAKDMPMKAPNVDTSGRHADGIGMSPAPVAAKAPAAPAKAAMKGASAVSRPQQAILNALAGFEALGIARPKRHHVALFADVSPNSSAFTNNLGSLRTAGLIDYPAGGMVTLTDGGRALAVAPAVPPTRTGLQRAWISRVSGPQGRILTELIACYPNAMSRETLANYAGASITSSAFSNNLGALRSLGLIDYPDKGAVAATALLFPEGIG